MRLTTPLKNVLILLWVVNVSLAGDAATPATCGGTVVDEQGKPINEVDVEVQWFLSSGIVREKRCKTDDAGRWQAPVPADVREVDIRLSHPDYVSDESQRQDKPPMPRLRDGTSVMVMKKGLRVSGIVHDEAGKPVVKALILPHHRYATSPMGAALEDSTTARTGADGRFLLAALPAGPRELTVTAAGFGPEAVAVDVTPDMATLQVTLRPGGVFEGWVVDGGGKPVADALVCCRGWEIRQQHHIFSLTAHTDAEGRFKMADAPLKGNVEFYVGRKGFLHHHGSVNLPADPSYRVTLYPEPVLSGTVLDAQTGEPVTLFEVARGIVWPNSTVPRWSRVEKVRSEKGAFAAIFDFMSTGDARPLCTVQIRAAGYVPEATAPVVVGDQSEPFVLRLHRARPWSGWVHDASDRPVATASVAWIGANRFAFIQNGRLQSQYVSSPEWVVHTDPNGRFELPPTEADGTILILHDTGYAWRRSTDFVRDAVVRLTSWCRVEGTVHVARSENHTVQLKIEPADPAWNTSDLRIRWFFNETSHVDGKFAFDFVPALRLAVGAVSDDKFFLADYVTPQPGQTCNVTIAVEPSGQVAPRSLIGRELPALDDMALAPPVTPAEDHPLLLCFFEFQQRPSRNCVLQLAKQAGLLEQQRVQVAIIQTTRVDRPQLDRWLKDDNIPFAVGMIRTDEDSARSAWGLNALPWLILTDKDHVVRAEGFSVEELSGLLGNK